LGNKIGTLLLMGIIILGLKTPLLGQDYAEIEIENLFDDIKKAFKVAGIEKGDIQLNEADKKIELRGVYKDYDEFLSAFMIAQARAGVGKVSPAYDPKVTVIKTKTAEKCLSYLILGNPKECKTYSYSPYFEEKKTFVYLPPERERKEVPHKEKKKKCLKEAKELKEKTAVVIAVGEYEDTKISKLDGPTNDANLVTEVLKKQGYNTIVLKDKNATLRNVIQTIEKEVNEVKPYGTFLLYISTHGAPIEPNGIIGFVMYDTNIKEEKCKTLERALTNVSQREKGAARARDIIVTANKMCRLLENSLKISDVLRIITSTYKPMRVITIVDACYSGTALKPLIERLKDEVYSPEPKVVSQLIHSIDKDLIYISAASGNELAMEYEMGGTSFGVFTYFYFGKLPKGEYNSELTYRLTFDDIKKTSSKACKSIKSRYIESKCSDEGQTPLYIKNKKNLDPVF